MTVNQDYGLQLEGLALTAVDEVCIITLSINGKNRKQTILIKK